MNRINSFDFIVEYKFCSFVKEHCVGIHFIIINSPLQVDLIQVHGLQR